MKSSLNFQSSVTKTIAKAAAVAVTHLRDGRFQRSMSLLAAISSFVSGLEVSYEHYKGSYSNPVMYSPVLLSGALTVAGVSAAFSRRAAVTVLRWTAAITLADGVIGFGFHIRGVARKPGGWRIPIVNIVMGPPIFAPLLFGTAAYLGLLASYLRREEAPALEPGTAVRSPYPKGWRTDIHYGKFQKQLCVISALWAVFSGFEAWYSHYKSRFRIWAQWTPVLLAPVQTAACIAAVVHKGSARTILPAASALTAIDGAIGFGYHARGIMRRPGGRKTWLYNILYGPPIFAPLLFSACGMLGLLASVLRREKS
ncbi:MAG TPA: hypothetical protein VH351_05400 [Bryobacteraceae bacterium]|nr:hypothetical protein [Bryobacteraceae bacterium]